MIFGLLATATVEIDHATSRLSEWFNTVAESTWSASGLEASERPEQNAELLKGILSAKSAAEAPTALTVGRLGFGPGAPFRLMYMPLRGLGDLPQLCLHYYEADYTMLHVGSAHMKELKPLLPFGRLPLLLAPADQSPGSIFPLAQSGAIVRHVFREQKMPSNQLMAEADMWFEQVKEAFGQHQTWGKAFNATALREATPSEVEAVKGLHYRGMRNRGVSYSPLEMSIAALHTFEERLGATQSHLTSNHLHSGDGEKVTFADLALFLQLFELLEDDNYPQALTALQLPNLARFFSQLAREERIVEFLQYKRPPRNGPHDGTSYPFKPGKTAAAAAAALHDEL